MRAIRRGAAICAVALAWAAPWAAAAVPLPPKPDRYVTDRTGRLDAARLAQLNETLATFERDSSTQVLLYVDARLPAGATLEETAAQALKEWGVGRKGQDNGVLFLAFLDDRAMRIEVGYGLEGAIPDARAHRIISEAVTPRFRAGDFTGGIEAAATQLMAAARSEPFQGTGRTVAEEPVRVLWPFVLFFILFVGTFILIIVMMVRWIAGMVGGRTYTSSGSAGSRSRPWSSGGSSNPSWSSGSSSSSSSSDSSSSFSGGGGSSGGGGASGSW